MTPPNLPLNGFIVLDLTAHRAGPTAVRQLADWGADVIKIEPPGEQTDATGSRRDGPDFQNLHRNKRSLTLESEEQGGSRRSSMKLAEKADVIVENFKSDREAPARRRLRGGEEDQPAHRLRQHLRASARTGPMRAAPGSTRSPRAWAA